MAATRAWRDFSGRHQALIVAVGAAETVLTGIALVDLARRPRAQLRGPRLLWALGCAIQPVGPLAYLLVGRCGRGAADGGGGRSPDG